MNPVNPVEYLRPEILQFSLLQMVNTYVALVLMSIAAFIASLDTHRYVGRYVVVLGISWAFAMARFDLLMHRAGAFMGRIEGNLGWETWKAQLVWSKRFLVTLDVMAALPILFLFFFGQWAAWRHSQSTSFCIWTILAFLVGLASIPASIWAAGQ